MSTSWRRSLPASKVLLKGVYFLFQCGVLLFEFFDHELWLCPSLGCKAHDQRSYGNYRTQKGEPVAMSGVESGYLGEGIRSYQSPAGLALQTGNGPAVGIDRRR